MTRILGEVSLNESKGIRSQRDESYWSYVPYIMAGKVQNSKIE